MNLLTWICFAPRRPTGTAVSGSQAPAWEPTNARLSPRSVEVLSPSPDRDTPPAAPKQKYLPVIDTDRCIGCERCIAACEHGCLEMIWSFSTLTVPQNCHGEGHCVAACPEQIIHMAWLLLEAPTTS